MKKSVRITVSVIVLVLLGLSISLNVYLATACGLINEPDSLAGSAYVNEQWNTHPVHIENGQTSREFYYSHNKADHICDVYLSYSEVLNRHDLYISYYTDFDSDDLEAEFYVKDSAGNTEIVESTTYIGGSDDVKVYWRGHHEGVYIEKIRVRSVD